ncbi:potassium channel family protein [Ammoniphilus sp. YIM 78166]|uniref:potassium channel family protein n=1 Tax=Ammoniphilus sp. YIM 78166 TaxID=1644106 RepID=UPI00106F8D48|nr:potassium channel family protein [Ammoniphilus sp. YIM 78166]
MNERSFLLYNLAAIFLFYLNVVISFALVYIFLDTTQWGPIVDHHASAIHQAHEWDRITRSLYFSAVTLLSVGYGDVTPLGWSKAIAILQAMIGYILPAFIVVNFAKNVKNGIHG